MIAIMVSRRRFLQSASMGLLAAPVAAQAQHVGRKVSRISWISIELPTTPPSEEPFWDRMRELGWAHGQNVVIERRAFGEDSERIPAIAKELIALGTDVFVANNSTTAIRIQRETRTIPIVVTTAGDLVAAHLADSLAHPGGQVTGIQVMQTELGAKHLSLLKEAILGLSRVGVLAADVALTEAKITQPRHATGDWIREIKARAPALGLQAQVVVVGEPTELERAFASFKSQHAQAVIVYGSNLTYAYRKTIVDLVAAHRLPSICLDASLVPLGHLMSYGWSQQANARLVADFVDKILRGAKPGDIPIQQPTKFLLVVNLRRAKTLDLSLPPSLLLQADQIIE